jgi:hypothetical protein
MDIHTWCAIPEAELARKSFFYIDDISLQVIEEPPLSISTPLDEFYTSEPIRWDVAAASPTAQIKVQLLSANRVIAEQTGAVETTPLHGAFETTKLRPGVYTLKASFNSLQGLESAAQCRILVVPSIFDPWMK